MNTPAPVLCRAAGQGGASLSDRLQGLSDSWRAMRPLLDSLKGSERPADGATPAVLAFTWTGAGGKEAPQK